MMYLLKTRWFSPEVCQSCSLAFPHFLPSPLASPGPSLLYLDYSSGQVGGLPSCFHSWCHPSVPSSHRWPEWAFNNLDRAYSLLKTFLWLPIACRTKSNSIKTREALRPTLPFSLPQQTLGTPFCSYNFRFFPTSGPLSWLLLCLEYSHMVLHVKLSSHYILRETFLTPPPTIQSLPHVPLHFPHNTTDTERIMFISVFTCLPYISPNFYGSSMTSGTCLILYWIPDI